MSKGKKRIPCISSKLAQDTEQRTKWWLPSPSNQLFPSEIEDVGQHIDIHSFPEKKKSKRYSFLKKISGWKRSHGKEYKGDIQLNTGNETSNGENAALIKKRKTKKNSLFCACVGWKAGSERNEYETGEEFPYIVTENTANDACHHAVNKMSLPEEEDERNTTVEEAKFTVAPDTSFASTFVKPVMYERQTDSVKEAQQNASLVTIREHEIQPCGLYYLDTGDCSIEVSWKTKLHIHEEVSRERSISISLEGFLTVMVSPEKQLEYISWLLHAFRSFMRTYSVVRVGDLTDSLLPFTYCNRMESGRMSSSEQNSSSPVTSQQFLRNKYEEKIFFKNHWSYRQQLRELPIPEETDINVTPCLPKVDPYPKELIRCCLSTTRQTNKVALTDEEKVLEPKTLDVTAEMGEHSINVEKYAVSPRNSMIKLNLLPPLERLQTRAHISCIIDCAQGKVEVVSSLGNCLHTIYLYTSPRVTKFLLSERRKSGRTPEQLRLPESSGDFCNERNCNLNETPKSMPCGADAIGDNLQSSHLERKLQEKQIESLKESLRILKEENSQMKLSNLELQEEIRNLRKLLHECKREEIPCDRERYETIDTETLSAYSDEISCSVAEKSDEMLENNVNKLSGATLKALPEACEPFVEEVALPESVTASHPSNRLFLKNKDKSFCSDSLLKGIESFIEISTKERIQELAKTLQKDTIAFKQNVLEHLSNIEKRMKIYDSILSMIATKNESPKSQNEIDGHETQKVEERLESIKEPENIDLRHTEGTDWYERSLDLSENSIDSQLDEKMQLPFSGVGGSCCSEITRNEHYQNTEKIDFSTSSETVLSRNYPKKRRNARKMSLNSDGSHVTEKVYRTMIFRRRKILPEKPSPTISN